MPSLNALVAELSLPERQKNEREIRRLRERVKEFELEAAERAADSASAAAGAQLILEELKEKLAAERERRKAAEAETEATRAELQEGRARAQSEFDAAKKAWEEDQKYLRTSLEAERTKSKSLQQRADGMQEELRKITDERDGLLVRLETEQAELMNRVAVLQQRMSSKSPTIHGNESVELEGRLKRQMELASSISGKMQAAADRRVSLS